MNTNVNVSTTIILFIIGMILLLFPVGFVLVGGSLLVLL
jgi:hypothetical protein